MLKPGALVFVMPNEVSNLQDITQWWRYTPGANWRHPGGPNTSIEGRANFPVVELAYDDIAPVGCYEPNALGLYDMVGNVWEWTSDVYAPGHDGAPAPDQTPALSAAVPPRVIKGGSFLCAPNYCMRYRTGSRQPQEADLGSSHVGFRTILIAPGPS
jgi:formylglycine-generating enzyme